MSGVSVIWYLLKTNAPLIALVPVAKIMAGDLPLSTVLPAIGVKQISSVPYNTIRINEAQKMHTDRVQVSVLCKGPQTAAAGTGYQGVNALLKLVLAACPSQRGTVNSIVVDSIVPDVEGPDLSDDASALCSRSRDFFVRWIGA